MSTKIAQAIQNNDMEAFQNLVKRGFNVNHVHKATGQTALTVCVFWNIFKFAKALVEAGAK